MRTYSITIRGTRGVHIECSSINDVIEELNMRLSQKEKDLGIVERLTTFRLRKAGNEDFQYLHAENSYRNITVVCQEFED